MRTFQTAIVAGFAAVALLVVPAAANAAQGFIVDQTELKAGPDDQFPTVVAVQAGAEVNVYGCLSGNSWCDISFQQDRGWVSGQDLEVIFQSKRVKIVEVTTVVVPVVTFEVRTYWTQYYESKPFFKDRDRFASINININNGGKAPVGKTGSGGQASTDTTGSISGKAATGGKPEAGGKAAAGGQANADVKANEKTGTKAATEGGASGQAATEKCPPGQKNCKPQGNAGEKAMGKTATGGGATGGETMGKKPQGAEPTANAKNCKPGTAGCQKGTGNGG